MRSLRLVAAFMAALVSPQVWPPAWAAPVSNFSLSSPTVQAGNTEVFTITRLSGGQGLYVLFQTSDGSAVAGTDYTATKQLVYFKGGVTSVTVSVPTKLNSNAIKLTFRAVIAASTISVAATGTILEPTQTCPDGSVLPLAQTCSTPPPSNSWVAAPLQDGGFARVKANDGLWDMTGPGNGRVLVPGEIVAVYYNGWGVEADNSTSFAIFALNDKTTGRAKASDLEGVAPVGAPPGLPTDWWVPGIVNAIKTCTDARPTFAGQPGITQGGAYRAAMVAGSHMKLASGQTGDASNMWIITGTGDQTYTAHSVVTGDCITGQ